MSRIALTKISAGVEASQVEGLARLIAYGQPPVEEDNFALELSSINHEPAFEGLADSGLIVIKGLVAARVAVSYDFERGPIPAIDTASITANCSVELKTAADTLIDPITTVKIQAGNPGRRATYYVMSATCSFEVA